MGAFRSDKHRAAKNFIDRWCDREKLTAEQIDWAAASDPGRHYNCFGYVVGKLRWWQPPYLVEGRLANPTDFWPDGVPGDTSVFAYAEAAKTEGFIDAADGDWEEGWETIVLFYTMVDNEFRHAARQKSSGVWDSKLGAFSDFQHPLNGLDNIWYGTGRLFMKRPWPRQRSSPAG